MNTGCIYKIKNIVNGKVYIGQSVNILKRKRDHFFKLYNNKHYNIHLQLSFNKYGKECFIFCIMEETYEDMLDVREIAWIRYYKSDKRDFGYNLESGGNRNKRHSPETIKKFSDSHKGKVNSLKTRQKMSRARMGHPTSEETKRKIGNANRGKRLSKEARLKMSLLHKGRKLSAEHRKKISEAGKGRKVSSETCLKISKALLGKSPSVETRRKISLALKGKYYR